MRVSQLRRGPRSLQFLALIVATCAAAFAAIAFSSLGGGAARAASPTCTTAGTGAVADFCFQPTSDGAGSDAGLDTSIVFNYTGAQKKYTVSNIRVQLAPGLLAIPNAVPTADLCDATDLGDGTCNPAAEVGTGTVVADEPSLFPKLIQLPASAVLYEMPGPDVADFGLDIWLGKNAKPGTTPDLTATASANLGTLAGQPVVDFAFNNLPPALGKLPIQVQQLSLDFNGTTTNPDGTASNTAYTRLPTNCVPAPTSLSVDIEDPTAKDPSSTLVTDAGAGGDSFTPTGCDSLAFSPQVSASAVRDANDLGVQFVNTVSQPANQAAEKSITLNVPPTTLGPNLIAASQLFGTVVGSATAVTPILANPLVGTVTLTGTIDAPTLTIKIASTTPAISLTLVGSVDILGNSVTFDGIPDVPISSLVVTLNGGSNSLYETTCAHPTGTLVGVLGAQNGASVTTNASFTVGNCGSVEPALTSPILTPATTSSPTTTTTPTSTSGKKTPPKISKGSLAGLASGNAKLGFTLTAGSAKLTSFTVSLPSGLQFDSKTYKHGVSLSGASAGSLKLSGGKLTVKLRSAASKVGVTLSAKAISEVTALRTKVKQKKVKKLTTSVVANSAGGGSTTLKLTLKV